MPPKSKAKKTSAAEQGSEAEASQGIDKVTTDSVLMMFEYCLSHGISEVVSSMSSPEFMDKYSLRAPIEQQLGLHLEFFLLRKSLQNKDFESAFSLWTSLIQSCDHLDCSTALAVRSLLAFASRSDITAQGLRNHADIVLPIDASSGTNSPHALARDKINKVLSAKLGSPAFMEAKEALDQFFPANSVAQQCLDVVNQHASALPRPLLEEMICHYKTTGEHAARNAHPPPSIEVISASELVDVAGGTDAFRKIWKCEHRDVQKFLEVKEQMRIARGTAKIDLQWHRVEASEASVLSARVAAAASYAAVASSASVASQPSDQGSVKRGRAAESTLPQSPPAVRRRAAPETAAVATPAAPNHIVQAASVKKALLDIGARTKSLHSEADPLVDMSSARINARQATSTRVAFSDDEDADEPKAASWKPKANLVTPAKPKSNPIPPARVKSKGPTGSTAWTETEVELLKKAVKEFGVGSWSKMKNKYKFQNPDRTELQLKDKVRNLMKTGWEPPNSSEGKKSGRSAASGSEFDL